MSTSPPAPGHPGLRLGSVAGVPIFLAPSWLLFAAFIVVTAAPPLVDRVGGQLAYVASVSFALLLGLSVLLHEVGHALVARAFDLPVRSITVTLLAGFTEITEPPQTPAREYAVAVAGPMVSLLLAAVGVGLQPLVGAGTLPHVVLASVALTNGLVAAFNLLPGLPLDGGRVLRSMVWRLSGDPDRATWASAWAGRVVAVVVVPALLLVVLPALGLGSASAASTVFAVFIAIFIYAGASAALRSAETARQLPGLTVARLARPALRVPSGMPLAEAVRRAHACGARALVVVDGADRVEAVVSEAAVVATPEHRRPWVSVGSLARRVEPGLWLDARLGGAQMLAAMEATPATEYVAQDPATGEVRVVVAADVAAALRQPPAPPLAPPGAS